MLDMNGFVQGEEMNFCLLGWLTQVSGPQTPSHQSNWVSPSHRTANRMVWGSSTHRHLFRRAFSWSYSELPTGGKLSPWIALIDRGKLCLYHFYLRLGKRQDGVNMTYMTLQFLQEGYLIQITWWGLLYFNFSFYYPHLHCSYNLESSCSKASTQGARPHTHRQL